MFINNRATERPAVITTTGATTLTYKQSGARVVTSTASGTTGYAITLPAMSEGPWEFHFWNNIAWTGTALTIEAAAADADKMVGTVHSSTGGNADSETTLGADKVTFAAGAALLGDSCVIFTDGTTIFVRAFCDADTGITLDG